MEDGATTPPAPAGYRYDVQGNLVHLRYDESGHTDIGVKGTVIPSAHANRNDGGNVAFDPHGADIPQNIVECTDGGGMRILATLTRAEIAAKQGIPAQPAPGVPAAAPFQGQAVEQLVGGVAGQLSIDLFNRGGVMAKKLAKKKTARRSRAKKQPSGTTSRRGENSPEPVPEQTMVPVTISGAFGQIVQQFSAAFRDGNIVVLAVDHRQLPAAFKFPALTTEGPMPLEISWAGQLVQCLWAGISFTLPDQSVTFSILFVVEEPSNEQGLAGEARADIL